MEKKSENNVSKEIVFFDTPYCLVRLNPEVPFLQIKWRSVVKGEQYREVLNLVLDIMRQEKVKKFINDDRDLPMIDPKDASWAANEWLPNAVALGYGKVAVVQNKEFFKKMPTNKMASGATEFYEGMIVLSYFKTVREAEEWLRKV
jgi:hypothetical protein